MDMKKQKVGVIMLSTKDKTSLLRNTYCFSEAHGNPLKYGEIENAVERGFEYQHLYFISDEDIKEFDWVYDPIRDNIFQSHVDTPSGHFGMKKAIASTEELFIKNCECKYGSSCDNQCLLPSIPEHFIKDYCTLGGINEISVEIDNREYFGVQQFKGNRLVFDNRTKNPNYGKVKLNTSNEVTTHNVKTSWIREEVEKIILDIMNLGMELRQSQLNGSDTRSGTMVLKEWKENNL